LGWDFLMRCESSALSQYRRQRLSGRDQDHTGVKASRAAGPLIIIIGNYKTETARSQTSTMLSTEHPLAAQNDAYRLHATH